MKDLTVKITNGSRTISKGLAWERRRVMTTRTAAKVLHRLINLDKMRTRRCDDDERARILGSHALARWAEATLETFDGGKYGGE
jgi:hypothetical protein